MKRTAFALITLCLLNGCVKTYTWTKDGASNAQFYKAKSYCDAISTGAAPIVHSGPSSSTTYRNGSVYSSSGTYGSYNETSTTYHNNTGQALANIGQTIQRQNMFNDCMRGEGWIPQSEEYDQYKPKTDWYFTPPDLSATSINARKARPIKKHLPQNLYREQTASSPIVTVLNDDQPLNVTMETKGMYKVATSAGDIGWIGKIWVYIVPEAEDGFEKEQISEIEARAQDGLLIKATPIVNKLPIDFYRQANSKGGVTFTLSEMSELIVLHRTETMFLVEDEEKHWGWVLKENVEIID